MFYIIISSNYLIFYSSDFILLPVHSPPVPHPTPLFSPSSPRGCLQSSNPSPPVQPSNPYSTRPPHSLGSQVSWVLGASPFTEARPGSPLLYMCCGPHMSWCMLPGRWLSVWVISGGQVSWDCWTSYGIALLNFFQGICIKFQTLTYIFFTLH